MKKIFVILFVLHSFLLNAQTINEYFPKIRNNQAELTAFISQMPKGGDLHNHYSGAIYAESYINWALKNDYWLNTQTLQVSADGSSGEDWTRFSVLDKEGKLNIYREKLMQLWSMKDYNGADAAEQHFFATFGLFSPLSNINYSDGLAELKQRAIAENVSYLEVMFSRVDLSKQNIDSTNEYNTILKNIQQQHDTAKLKQVLDRLYYKIMQLPVKTA